MNEKETQQETIKSPLARWPGEIKLPAPDEFTGEHWQTWRTAVDQTNKAGVEEVNRLFAYAGAAFIEKHGEWAIKGVTLAEFKSWQNAPAKEMMRFASWLGKSMRDYITDITNPKE